jgi:hypothetical protein
MPWTKMVSMELDDEDVIDAIMPMPMPEKPRYPCGLKICLDQRQLAKLGLEPDCEIGDVIDMRAFARVTSVSMNETEHSGQECRIELQIEELALEDESQEGPED